MDVYLKTSLAQRDPATGKLSVHHAGDKITVTDMMGKRMVAMNLAEVREPMKQPTRRGRKPKDAS